MAAWRLNLLGECSLAFSGQAPIRLPLGQSLVLLGRLALAGRSGCTRISLADALWPTEPSPVALHRLRQALVKLRCILDHAAPAASSIVGADRARIWLAQEICTCDFDAFETAIRDRDWSVADALYSGDLLPGCDDRAIHDAREPLRIAYREALRNWIDELEHVRNFPAAIETAQRLSALEPHDELASLHVIRLLLADGRVDTARLRYRKLRRDTMRIQGGKPLSAELRRQVRSWIAAAIEAKPSMVTAAIHETSENATAVEIDALRLLSEMRRHGILDAVNPGDLQDLRVTPYISSVRDANLYAGLSGISAAMTSSERENLRRRHAQACLGRMREAASLWQSPRAAAELAGIDRDHQEIEAALDHLESANPAEALGLAAGLHWHGYVRGRFAEGRQRLDRLLHLTAHDRYTGSDAKARADSLLASGHFANCMGDNNVAFARYSEARRVYRQLGDADGVALTLMREGNAAQESGLYPLGQRLCEEAVAHFQKTGDEPRLLVALFYLSSGYGAAAVEALKDVIHIARSLGDERYLALGLYGRAQCLLMSGRGEPRQSAPLLADALRLLQRQPDVLGCVYTMNSLGNLLATRGDCASALTAFSIVDGIRKLHNLCVPYAEAANPRSFFHPAALCLKQSRPKLAETQQGEHLAASPQSAIRFAQQALGK